MNDVLDFWFGAPGSAEHGTARREWFVKDAAFDALIAQRFGARVEAALAGQSGALPQTAEGMLGRIVVLDQFTRNMFRDTPRAFAGDAQALALARRLLETGMDHALAPLQRWFAYLPFEHSEDAADQIGRAHV